MNDVTLLCGEISAHYTQIYTGFFLLERLGLVRIRNVYNGTGVGAIINGRRVYFDVQDGWNLNPEQLELADAYYKRSYAPHLIKDLEGAEKVRPLGLNYEIYPDEIDLKGVWRALRLGETFGHSIGEARRAMRCGRGFTPRLNAMESPPAPDQEPGVLFLTRTWDPDGHQPKHMPSRDDINEGRARCISAIRREFGGHALAGFGPTQLAKAQYPDLVVSNPIDKKNYIELLRHYPVCVATTGLHGSIGWKMGEYVAFSKAIVSERLNYTAPGFEAHTHFLTFDDADACVEQVGRLFDDRDLRRQMMYNNAEYYRSHLRPDQLVARALGLQTRPGMSSSPLLS